LKTIVSITLSILASFITAQGQHTCKNIGPTAEGLLVITRVVNGIRKSGFISRTGVVVVDPKYDEVYSFSDGLALVRSGDLYGFLDINGKEKIPPKFENACSFSEGLASVKVSGKYGYINPQGEVKIPAQFESAYNFSEGMAIIKASVKAFRDKDKDIVEEQYGYIDKTGKTVIATNFDAASDFRGGIAKVIDSVFGLETYINKDGKVIGRQTIPAIEGFGVAPSLIDVKFNSTPGGATIYLIPKRRIELEEDLPTRDENTLFEFKVPVLTNNTFKTKQKVFTVLFILNGARQSVPLDVRPDGSNSAEVKFP